MHFIKVAALNVGGMFNSVCVEAKQVQITWTFLYKTSYP